MRRMVPVHFPENVSPNDIFPNHRMPKNFSPNDWGPKITSPKSQIPERSCTRKMNIPKIHSPEKWILQTILDISTY